MWSRRCLGFYILTLSMTLFFQFFCSRLYRLTFMTMLKIWTQITISYMEDNSLNDTSYPAAHDHTCVCYHYGWSSVLLISLRQMNINCCTFLNKLFIIITVLLSPQWSCSISINNSNITYYWCLTILNFSELRFPLINSGHSLSPVLCPNLLHLQPETQECLFTCYNRHLSCM
jgi:hypothetical protein